MTIILPILALTGQGLVEPLHIGPVVMGIEPVADLLRPHGEGTE